MKRNFILSLIFGSVVASAYAQGEMDAFNLSYSELTGTAQSVGMGGAMGALGGNISAISINPAGIGVYKSSEVVTTLNFANTKTKTDFNGIKMDDNKFKFDLSNIAFVGTFPIDSDVAPLINFGFSYNNLRSFDRKTSMRGNNIDNSLTANIADRANGAGKDAIINGTYANNGEWLGMLGYDAGIIRYNNIQNRFESSFQGKTSNDLYMREKGYVNSYDFNVGTTFSDMLSIGVTLAVTDIDYRLYSDYNESFTGNSYFLENYLKTEGTGWQVKAGLIFKPIKELRIGVAYHSPTWYEMTDYYNGYLDVNTGSGWKTSSTPEDGAYTDYKLRTPDKWTFSLAGLIGKTAIITADYELTNYGNMHLSERNEYGYRNGYASNNNNIKEDFRNSSTLRVGAQINATDQFSIRVGYMWQQSPVKDILKDGSENGSHTAATVGTIPQYTLVGDANYFTYGLGYAFKNGFYTDVAFIMMNRKDDLYAYGGAEKAELKNNKYNGLLTLGFRF